MGEKLGLSHQALFDVASASSGQCWALTSYCPVPGPVPASPANNDYKPGFAAALMLKDLKLAREAAKSVKVKNAIGAHAAEIYEEFAQQGHGGVGFLGHHQFHSSAKRIERNGATDSQHAVRRVAKNKIVAEYAPKPGALSTQRNFQPSTAKHRDPRR